MCAKARLREFRWQSYAIGIAGGIHTLGYYNHGTTHHWIAYAIAAAFAYAGAWRASRIESADLDTREWKLVGWATCGATALFGTAIIGVEVPDRYIGAALWGFALVLLELGLQRLPLRLRLFSYPVAVMAMFAVIGGNGDKLMKFAPQAALAVVLHRGGRGVDHVRTLDPHGLRGRAGDRAQ